MKIAVIFKYIYKNIHSFFNINKLKNILCLEKYEKLSNLGIFTLRDEERTIGFGKVMKIKPLKI